jgi:Fe-S-cluster containining protein
MNEDTGRFQCRNCGRCCHNLLSEDLGITRGLTLLPNEVLKFEKGLVKPAIGHGTSPDDLNFHIIAYQLIKDDCPHFEGNLCKIYESRPVSCHQFPFSLEPRKHGTVLGVDMNCPSAKALVESNQTYKFMEREWAEKLLLVKMMVSMKPDLYWFYDLSSCKWIKYSVLVDV